MLLVQSSMACIQDSMLAATSMGLHGGEWRTHASAVDDCELIIDSMRWLSGEESEITTHREKSALGAPMQTICVKMKAKQSIKSLQRIDDGSLKNLLENGISQRIDEHKFLHIRLNLENLVQGEASVINNPEEVVIKGKFKLEVYPGQEASLVAEELISRLVG